LENKKSFRKFGTTLINEYYKNVVAKVELVFTLLQRMSASENA
jgi:hypothetical protein